MDRPGSRPVLRHGFLYSWPCIVETREEHSAPIPTSDWHTTWTGRAGGAYCATVSCTVAHASFLDSWSCIVETQEEHSSPIPTSDRRAASAGRLTGGHCTEASDTVSHAIWKHQKNILLPYRVLAKIAAIHALWKREKNILVPYRPVIGIQHGPAGPPAGTAPLFPVQLSMHCGSARRIICSHTHK